MTAFAVPLVCRIKDQGQDQAVQFAQLSYSYLVKLELADHPTEDCGSELDLLTGTISDGSFFTGNMKRGNGGWGWWIRTRRDEDES